MKTDLRLSIVIPAYNAATLLERATRHVEKAVQQAGIKHVEIVIVNDGSSDDTSKVARALSLDGIPVNVVELKKNQGRFLARKQGVEAARYDHILFVDTRVLLHEQSLAFLCKQFKEFPDRKIWNGHVVVAKKGNIIARFWDAVVYIGWRRYFAHPRLTSFGLEDFDFYPKGTGCFFAPRAVLMDATEQFLKESHDLRFSSDDTLLIRIMAQRERIWLSPDFSCTYYSRTSIHQFIPHTYHRGIFFVDGFLRRGTRFFYPLIGFLAISVGILVLLVIHWQFIIPLLGIVLLVWALELITALLLGVPPKDALSLFAISPLFAACYGAGIWRGTIKRLL